jgi:short-subunit dehydrogenase
MAGYWQGKNVVVSGGSSGLGLAIARAMFEAGANVTLVARTCSNLEAARSSISLDSSRVQTACCDVTKADEVDRLFGEECVASSGIHAFIHAVGRSSRGAILDTTVEALQGLMEVNFYSAVHCTRRVLPMLMKSQGHLVYVGSLASKSAGRYLDGYPAAKFALAAYSQQLRLELGPRGLHVLLVCPGPIQRSDAGRRYDHISEGIPERARGPGAGVKLRAIDPDRLARRVLRACEKRKPELVVPASARLLFAISQLSPTLGDWILRKRS